MALMLYYGVDGAIQHEWWGGVLLGAYAAYSLPEKRAKL